MGAWKPTNIRRYTSTQSARKSKPARNRGKKQKSQLSDQTWKKITKLRVGIRRISSENQVLRRKTNSYVGLRRIHLFKKKRKNHTFLFFFQILWIEGGKSHCDVAVTNQVIVLPCPGSLYLIARACRWCQRPSATSAGPPKRRCHCLHPAAAVLDTNSKTILSQMFPVGDMRSECEYVILLYIYIWTNKNSILGFGGILSSAGLQLKQFES